MSSLIDVDISGVVLAVVAAARMARMFYLCTYRRLMYDAVSFCECDGSYMSCLKVMFILESYESYYRRGFLAIAVTQTSNI